MLKGYLKNRKKWLGFDDFWLIVLGTPVVGTIMSILFFKEFQKINPYQVTIWDCLGVGMMYTLIYWLVFTQFAIFMREKMPNFKQNTRRILLTCLGIVGLYFVVEHFIIRWIRAFILGIPFSETSVKDVGPAIGTLLISFLCISIYENIYYNKQLLDVISEKEQLAQANLRSELEGLKNQINPHFFFNSLNTLMDIVNDDPKLATRYIQNLSKLYRYVLESGKKELVPLEDELNAIKSFSFILLERFKGNLSITIDVPDVCKNCFLPPISLQMLIENCIKHNVISSKSPLSITITTREDKFVMVSNNLQKKNSQEMSTGLGLENIKKRYKYFTETEILQSQLDDKFTIGLPLLAVNNPIYESIDY